MDAQSGTTEADELEVLATLVESYETEQFPIATPNPIEAILFRMEQGNLTQANLAKYIGGRARVSEILSGKRNLTLNMIRALHQHLGIPAESLIGNIEALTPGLEKLDHFKFPMKEMVKRGWFSNIETPEFESEALLSSLVQQAGGLDAIPRAFYKKTASPRLNARTDTFALQAWCLKVLGEARENPPKVKYSQGSIDNEFLRFLSTLSRLPDGPRHAVAALSERGIAVVGIRHLPRTYLDGAAMLTKEGIPVIGLTLRYDRLDNFWFCLLHEVAHIWKHVSETNSVLIDDLTLEESDRDCDWSVEHEADQIAQDALIPPEAWASFCSSGAPMPSRVINFAQSINVHPTIVAGRVRKETGNYRLLSQFVGSKEVSKNFEGIR